MFLTVIEFMLFLIEREKNKQIKETIKPNFIGKNFGKYSNCPIEHFLKILSPLKNGIND